MYIELCVGRTKPAVRDPTADPAGERIKCKAAIAVSRSPVLKNMELGLIDAVPSSQPYIVKCAR